MRRRVVMAVPFAAVAAPVFAGDADIGSMPAARAAGARNLVSAPMAQPSTPSSSMAAFEIRPLAGPLV